MPSIQAVQIPEVLGKIRQKIDAAREKGLPLKLVERDDYKLDDDWLCVFVMPSEPGMRAYDYAEALSTMETELEAEGFENLLLLPDVPE